MVSGFKFYIGNTDYDWYSFLKSRNPEDINFWQPGGKTNFKALPPGGPFLLKLKSPYNSIAGVGFFSSQSILPVSIAWDAFGAGNGCTSLEQLRAMISKYRREWWDENPQIGCIVLTNPIFFDETDWINIPADWSKSIVQGKTYFTGEAIGKELWIKIEERIAKYFINNTAENQPNQLTLVNSSKDERYNQILAKIRIGQGAFRVLVTDAYSRKCSISGEKTLPVLDAAHIRPFSNEGPHYVSNGLLLRSDIHKLFDSGYMTITDDYKVEVSRRIKEEFSNGREYYRYHGGQLLNLPENPINRPGSDFINWHNEHVYLG